MRKFSLTLAIVSFILLKPSVIFSQERDINYDESKVLPYSLPSILTSYSGMIINNSKDWQEFRKPELLNTFTHLVYGRVPGGAYTMKAEVTEEALYMDGAAKRRQVTITFEKNGKEIKADLIMYLPATKSNVSLFLGYNFQGNHTIADDKEIFITKSWVPVNEEIGVNTNVATEKSRGTMKNRWPVEDIVRAGYGVATLYRGDIDPDKDDLSDGIHNLFYEDGQTRPEPDEWGTIALWSWGLSRVMDYLETVEEINSEKIIVVGHSRLGKVALWAAATDNRFAASISNNSGAMGAALSKRNFGETVEVINTVFPHWFCDNFKKYSGKEYMLPVDQHMVISLIAPRPVYVASATEDLWADPKGEFLGIKEASVVYNMYGIQGLSSASMPEADAPIIGEVSYHLRTGNHNITRYDWEQYIRFAKHNGF